MAKMTINLTQLQKLTEKGRKRAEREENKKKLSESQKNDAEAKKWADGVILGLPATIKKEAMKGSDCLIVNLPSDFSIHDRVKRNISRWALDNGLSVATQQVRYSDDSSLEEVLVISWSKKK